MHHPLSLSAGLACGLILGGCAAPRRALHSPPAQAPPLELEPWNLPTEPGPLTRHLLQAANEGDGATIASALHPKTADVWSRRAALRGQGLAAYCAFYFSAFNDFGHMYKIEAKTKGPRAEVELHFRRKHRDVDFHYRWHSGRWTLAKLDDYP